MGRAWPPGTSSAKPYRSTSLLEANDAANDAKPGNMAVLNEFNESVPSNAKIMLIMEPLLMGGMNGVVVVATVVVVVVVVGVVVVVVVVGVVVVVVVVGVVVVVLTLIFAQRTIDHAVEEPRFQNAPRRRLALVDHFGYLCRVAPFLTFDDQLKIKLTIISIKIYQKSIQILPSSTPSLQSWTQSLNFENGTHVPLPHCNCSGFVEQLPGTDVEVMPGMHTQRVEPSVLLPAQSMIESKSKMLKDNRKH
uniref:Uncharacterized protein n=1 Tax=Romanomermis culicivorax TaxID=13658 RepID=A0A915LEQ2_ROMCU